MNGWLLLLGSNRDGEVQVRQAMLKLVDLGAPRALTPIRAFEADGSGEGEFHNALVQLDAGADRQRLEAALKQIEQAMGRRHDDQAEVVIDIDILARQHDGRWQPDPHARDKGEFMRVPVRALLEQAGIELEPR